MSKIEIDEEVLQQLLKQVTENQNKKRKEGSFELYGNGRARLYYTLNLVIKKIKRSWTKIYCITCTKNRYAPF